VYSVVTHVNNVKKTRFHRPIKLNHSSLQSQKQLTYSTEISLLFIIIPEHTDAYLHLA